MSIIKKEIIKSGQLARLTRLPPDDFVATYKGTPIMYNYAAKSLVYAYTTGWRMLDVLYSFLLFLFQKVLLLCRFKKFTERNFLVVEYKPDTDTYVLNLDFHNNYEFPADMCEPVYL